jgi:hypothetical protein
MFTEPLPNNDGGDTQTYRQTATLSHKPTSFFKNKESRLKTDIVEYKRKAASYYCASPIL